MRIPWQVLNVMRGPCIVGGAPVKPRYCVTVKDTLATECWNATTSGGVNAVEGLHHVKGRLRGVACAHGGYASQLAYKFVPSRQMLKSLLTSPR